MRRSTFARLVVEMARSSRIQSRFVVRDLWRLALAARHAHKRPFVRHVVRDAIRFGLNRVRPVRGETLLRAQAAARWLARAHDATGKFGASYGYFPCRSESGWRGAYPETTGYTVPTLLDYALVAGDPEYVLRGIEMARWELECQMESGATPGGEYRPNGRHVAVAFNTGMVLQGLSAAYRTTKETVFAEGARRAAEFLLRDIDDDGYFRSHGPFVWANTVKTYTCLCAWPLYRAGLDFGEERYLRAARRVGDAALQQENDDGWFANNCLGLKLHAPLLHTIGYTLQGLLELGIISGEQRYVAAVTRAAERLLPFCEGGFLHARWYSDWQPASFSSCLTGSAQIAVVCYRLADHTGDPRYRSAADSVLNYLKALQAMESGDANLVGALGGSFPLFGSYMRFGFPEWATKFYLDALLWQHRFMGRSAGAAVGLSANGGRRMPHFEASDPGAVST